MSLISERTREPYANGVPLLASWHDSLGPWKSYLPPNGDSAPTATAGNTVPAAGEGEARDNRT